MTTSNYGKTFDHFAINVSSIRASVEWYRLECSAVVLYEDESWALLEVGGIKLALTLGSQHPPHIAFRCRDRHELERKGPSIGCHRDGTEFLYTSDLDGNFIEWIYYPQNCEGKSDNKE
jgi:catechol-2,3-dioxygenase